MSFSVEAYIARLNCLGASPMPRNFSPVGLLKAMWQMPILRHMPSGWPITHSSRGRHGAGTLGALRVIPGSPVQPGVYYSSPRRHHFASAICSRNRSWCSLHVPAGRVFQVSRSARRQDFARRPTGTESKPWLNMPEHHSIRCHPPSPACLRAVAEGGILPPLLG